MKDDAISRQAAIDICNFAIDFWHGQLGEGIVIAVRKRIEQLPAVQSQTEIIRCKDCAFSHRYIDFDGSNWIECRNPNGLNRDVSDDGYCYAGAERRTDD